MMPQGDSRLQIRPTAATALWGHLLRKPESAITVPDPSPNVSLHPITPLDKTGTSTRILLHDTQAHLEKFSDRVDRLVRDVGDAKMEIVTVQKLFQHEHEKLIEETVGLVNRCQTELQKALGRPAQTQAVDDLRKDLTVTENSLQRLDRKIDALTMLNQTQTQALQTLQDQQAQILAALAPVVPMLQTLPVRIENASHDIKDVIRSTCMGACVAMTNPQAACPSNKQARPPIRESSVAMSRQESSSPPDGSSPLGKKRRFNEEPSEETSRYMRRSNSRADQQFLTPSSNMHTHNTAVNTPASSKTRLSVKKSLLRSAQVGPIDSALLTISRRTLPSCEPLSTPRRIPLGSLHVPNEHVREPTPHGLHTNHNSPTDVLPRFRPTLRSFVQPAHSLASQLDGPLPTACDSLALPPLTGTNAANLAAPTSTALQVRSRLLDTRAQLSAIASSDDQHPELTESSEPLAVGDPAPPARHSLQQASTQSLGAMDTSTRSPPLRPVSTFKEEGTTALSLVDQHPNPSQAVHDSIWISGSGKPMRLKDRRALIPEPTFRTEGKRFIPLDDDDDDDDDDADASGGCPAD